jgi:hypothetical protein
MADASLLHPSAVDIPAPEIHEATILDDAKARGEAVRCIVPFLDPGFASDPMMWNPHTWIDGGSVGEYWPKQGDRAQVSEPVDGPPAILEWWPALDATPDLTA